MMNSRIEDRGLRVEDRGQTHLDTDVAQSSFLNPKSSNGFSLLEFIVVIGVISILIGAILNRIPAYQEQAEKTVMEQTAAAMQSALVMRVGTLMARGATGKELNELASDNPIGWLQQKPKNYAGEFFDPAPNAVRPGQWFFDLKSRDLIYVPDRSEYFKPGKDGKKWVRFHVKLEYEAPVGAASGKDKQLAATLFEATEPYRWFE